VETLLSEKVERFSKQCKIRFFFLGVCFSLND